VTPSLRQQLANLRGVAAVRCVAKRSWPTRKEAIRASSPRAPWKLAPYRCSVCGRFHLTRQIFGSDTVGGLAAQL
jgi:hypothetical protein